MEFDWTSSPDGQRVAWIEAEAPPGESPPYRSLPNTIYHDNKAPDPEPLIKAVAVWDRATGKTQRFPVSKLVWGFSPDTVPFYPALYWRNDGASLLYTRHISDATEAKYTVLYQLNLDGTELKLAEHRGFGNVNIYGESNDGSIYYGYFARASYLVQADGSIKYVNGADNFIRLYSNGKVEVLRNSWTKVIDIKQNRLEELQWNSVVVTDLSTGEVRRGTFQHNSGSDFDPGFGTLESLVPISPDSRWAIFAGTHSDYIPARDGELDRTVRIIPIK